MTSVDPHWLAELGPAFYGIQEKGARGSTKSETASQFNRQTELEMQMAEDRIKQAQEDEEMRKAKAMVSSTPRVVSVGAKVGATPRTARGTVGSTPRRRFGM